MCSTAGSRSSKPAATSAESRSSPSVSCVMSLLPIENPSKKSRNLSASTALDGSSHIIITCSPRSPRTSPFLPSSAITPSASFSVRTNGIISFRFVRPISSRTNRMASHSIAKASRKSTLM